MIFQYKTINDIHVIAAYEESEYVGEIHYKLEEGLPVVQGVNVAPANRGNGIATAICVEFVNHFVELGLMELGSWDMSYEGFVAGQVKTIPFGEKQISFATVVLDRINPK